MSSRTFRTASIVIAVVGLCGFSAGCKTNTEAMAYEYEAHHQMVSQWCLRNGQGPTPALLDECVRRAWEELPPTPCNNRPCTQQFSMHYGYVKR
jgi:hypothetical protein